MITLIYSGLSLGALYAVVAFGYNIVFGSTRIFNFAYAQQVMLGVFIAYWTTVTLKLPTVACFLVGGALGAAAGYVIELVALRTIRRDSSFGPLITTIGIGVVLDAVVEQVWGSTPLTVPFFGSARVVSLFSGRTQVVDIVLVLVAVVTPVALAAWNGGTLTGLIMTTAAEDRDAASLRGVNVERTITGSMVATGAFAGLLGPVIAPMTFANVSLGDNLAILAFVALAFGGFGATAGPLVGGMGVGLIEAFSQRYLPSGAANLVVFGVLLCCLMLRPHGLLGKAEYARVL